MVAANRDCLSLRVLGYVTQRFPIMSVPVFEQPRQRKTVRNAINGESSNANRFPLSSIFPEPAERETEKEQDERDADDEVPGINPFHAADDGQRNRNGH